MRTKSKTTKLPEVQENAGDQVVIDFFFASDWLREWCKFSGPITEGSKVKTKQPITFDSGLKIVLSIQ